MLEVVNAETKTYTDAAAQIVDADKTAAQIKIIKLIRVWSQPKERWADLRSRARTPQAHELIARLCGDIEALEHGRIRKRRDRSRAKFSNAIERIVGDLLRVKAGTTSPALIFRSIGKSNFERDQVKYETFSNVLNGLKELQLVGHRIGRTRFRKVEFDPGEAVSISLTGRASRFWATGRLLGLAAAHGIDSSNVREHFAPEPPMHPLVLKDYPGGRGRKKPKAPRINFKHTAESRHLEQDIRELNLFLAGFKLTGGEHEGYIRVFNNNSWKKGGRLYSVGGPQTYQQIHESKRLKMTINGEPVSEIDIKASQLTIYLAMVGEPLEGSGDPYVRAGIDRWIAKKWIVISFGNGAPLTKWPVEALDDYEERRREHKEETGEQLPDLPKARDVARKMLTAFPALKKLNYNLELWGDLQYREAEAVIGAMLILMRTHGVPSLSMHDGIIVPRSKADLAKTVMKQEFLRVVGVEPILTVEPDEEQRRSILELAKDL